MERKRRERGQVQALWDYGKENRSKQWWNDGRVKKQEASRWWFLSRRRRLRTNWDSCVKPWSSAEIHAHRSDLIWSNLIWSNVIRRRRIDFWHTSHSSNVSLSLSLSLSLQGPVLALEDVNSLPICTCMMYVCMYVYVYV